MRSPASSLWAWDLGNPGVDRRAARRRGLYPRHAQHVDHRIRRRGARPRLPAARQFLRRLLRLATAASSRTSTRPRSSRVDVTTGRDGLALPDRQQRRLGLRSRQPGDAGRFPRRGRRCARAGPAQQAGRHLHPRSPHRRAACTGVEQRETPQGGVEPDYLCADPAVLDLPHAGQARPSPRPTCGA